MSATFSATRVGELFGRGKTGGSTAVSAWIKKGWIEAELVAASGVAGKAYQIFPQAVVRFLQEHPEAYEPLLIKDDRLRRAAQEVHRRDPLVPAFKALKERTGHSESALRRLISEGKVPHLRRGRNDRPHVLLTSDLDAAVRAVESILFREDPLAQLHTLLDTPPAETAPKPERTTPAPPQDRVRPVSPQEWSERQRGRPGPKPNPSCDNCGGRTMKTWSIHNGQIPVYACLQCQHEQPRALPASQVS